MVDNIATFHVAELAAQQGYFDASARHFCAFAATANGIHTTPHYSSPSSARMEKYQKEPLVAIESNPTTSNNIPGESLTRPLANATRRRFEFFSLTNPFQLLTTTHTPVTFSHNRRHKSGRRWES